MKTSQLLKRLVLGRTMASGELEHTLLPKTIALPVFASDPLSSNAYATQEILIVLGAAGVGALANVVPISIAVALLLATVVTSYRQTVRAYPSGGGAYRVARENIGLHAGLLAAAALLLDYVLTVAVSITAGVDAIVAMAPDLSDVKVLMVVGFIAFVTMMNLRGVRESGTLFAIPTYGFVLSIYLMIITGFVRCLGGCPQAETAGLELHHAAEPLTLFLIFKAFAAGTTALTGVEAIADGVQAFRYPQSKNAATTLLVMGLLATSMFLGISALADGTNVVYEHGDPRTVVAQVANAVFGGGALFYVVQVMTAGILILAANTAFQDFPRLSSILAQDRFMPHQFLSRGDRLVFSNGVVILSVIASFLVVAFGADLNRLIQLYLVGVFISFTLSQSGMVLRWHKLKTPGWRKSMAINGFGATVTGVVLCVVLTTKFLGGAWIITIAIPVVMYLMYSIHRHYNEVARHLADEARLPVDRRPGNHSMVVLVERVDVATARAVGYVHSIRPGQAKAVTFDEANAAAFKRLAPGIALTVLERKGRAADAIKSYLAKERKSIPAEDFLTLVTPELLKRRGLWEVITHPRLHRLKAAFLAERHVQILDIPILRDDIDPGHDETSEPARNYVVVLVSAVNNATLQAIEYAETLGGTDLRAVSFGIDEEATTRLADEWMQAKVQAPLELEESAFRDIGQSLVSFIRRFNADGRDRVVTVVLPEFVVSTFRHQLLHGQTALLVKRHLLFERGVVVASVPYHLEDAGPDR
ncbi:MAG: APC family permease [Actinomycetota bacterium]|nr:APC family permease [Actinomycetota bacterium]